jgi:hypothetical protein
LLDNIKKTLIGFSVILSAVSLVVFAGNGGVMPQWVVAQILFMIGAMVSALGIISFLIAICWSIGNKILEK